MSRILNMLKAILLGAAKGVDFLFGSAVDLALLPFRLLGGQANMPPPYVPQKSGEQLLDDLKHVRESRPGLQQDVVNTIQKYARANSSFRSTMDLSALHANVRACLLTMNEAELDALARAQPHAVRLFALGKEHGMHGLPTVDLSAEPKVSTPNPPEWDGPPALRAIQARLLREMRANGGARDFKMPAL